MTKFAVAVLLFASAISSPASKEGILAFSRFHIESDGIGSSGRVVVDGRQDGDGQLVELKIIAFGRSFVVSKPALARLKHLPANGIRLSYEHGYKQLGGRTLYVHLQMGFTSAAKKQALITLKEDGQVVCNAASELPRDRDVGPLERVR